VVNGKEMPAAFTKILAGATLFAFLNGFNAPALWTFMVPFFLAW